MSDESTSIRIEEEEAWQREQGLTDMEAELHQKEQGLLEMESAFRKRTAALENLVSYIADQERNLLARAQAIGPKARQLVEKLVREDEDEMQKALDFGKEDDRRVLLERRQEVLDVRMQLVEDRDALYSERLTLIDEAEGRIASMEEALMAREMEISQALRKLITQASELAGPAEPSNGPAAPAAEPPPAPEKAASDESKDASRRRESMAAGREPMMIIGGEVPARPSKGKAKGGKEEKAARERELEEEAYGGGDEGRHRRRARNPAYTTQVRFNLEANMGAGEGHHFFRYEDDSVEDLPGLFIATHNLLKEDREVEVTIGLGATRVKAKGVVAWRHKPGEEDHQPGMGVELTWVEDAGRGAIKGWIAEHPPEVV